MAIITIENDIISQLQSSITDLKIEGFPENIAEYKLIHPKGAVLVRFQGASYGSPEGNCFIQQTGTLDFNLVLMVRGLRDKNGSYNYIDSVLSVLTGYAPTDCGKMYATRVAFSGEAGGIYRYALNFSVPIENYSE